MPPAFPAQESVLATLQRTPSRSYPRAASRVVRMSDTLLRTTAGWWLTCMQMQGSVKRGWDGSKGLATQRHAPSEKQDRSVICAHTRVPKRYRQAWKFTKLTWRTLIAPHAAMLTATWCTMSRLAPEADAANLTHQHISRNPVRPSCRMVQR